MFHICNPLPSYNLGVNNCYIIYAQQIGRQIYVHIYAWYGWSFIFVCPALSQHDLIIEEEEAFSVHSQRSQTISSLAKTCWSVLVSCVVCEWLIQNQKVWYGFFIGILSAKIETCFFLKWKYNGSLHFYSIFQ